MDTSILVAFYIPEALSSEVDRYIHATAEPAISSLTEVEIASAVSRKLREGGIDRRSAAEVLRTFERHVGSGLFRKVVVEGEHFEMARQDISGLRLPLRTLDALHLAVCVTGQYELITADPQMARNAKALGIAAELLAPPRGAQ